LKYQFDGEEKKKALPEHPIQLKKSKGSECSERLLVEVEAIG